MSAKCHFKYRVSGNLTQPPRAIAWSKKMYEEAHLSKKVWTKELSTKSCLIHFLTIRHPKSIQNNQNKNSRFGKNWQQRDRRTNEKY